MLTRRISATWLTLAASASVLLSTGSATAFAPAASAVRDESVLPSASWSTSRIAAGEFLDVSLVVDAGGVRHLAVDGPDGITYLDDRGGTWHRQLVLANSDGAPHAVRPSDTGPHDTWGMPSIALDDRGRVTIAAVYGALDSVPGSTSGIWMVTDKGRSRGTFGAPRKIAGRRATDPSLKLANGHIDLAYGTYPRMGPGFRTPVWFKTDASGAWTRTRVASQGRAPSLRMDVGGHARIAFLGQGAVRYARATTAIGAVVVTTVTGSTGTAGDPSLALDAAGRPRVSWSTDSPALYSAWSGGAWATPVSIGPRAYRVALSLDAAGRPHVVLATDDVLHAWRDASGWHQETIAAGVSPLEVAIRASASGLVIAWTQGAGSGVWIGER
jgi:hypothetical protein